MLKILFIFISCIWAQAEPLKFDECMATKCTESNIGNLCSEVTFIFNNQRVKNVRLE